VSEVPILLPTDEIVAVGAQDSLQSVPITGTVAYLAAGNAWVMRDNSAARRPVTTEGDLDGRVLDLSPDGRILLYTRRLEADIGTPINQLWMVNTTIVGESPISMPARGVLYAAWSPDGNHIAYSTSERTTSPPGWRANNDLWIGKAGAATIARATQVISPNTNGAYSWWGTAFSWAPDGHAMAYARPDQIGTVDVVSRTTTVLAEFPAYNTYSEWVWTPGLSWSPDSHFVAATLHGPPLEAEDAQDSPVFDLWLFAANGTLKARVATQVGMWCAPSWGQAGIMYGQAVDALHSVDSRYALVLRDGDGSNPRRLFPVAGEPGVLAPPEIAWSPSGDAFIFVYNGNLYLGDVKGGAPRQLTSDGQNSRPRWAARRPNET
jgi:Tol biopolymer transport system component